MFGLKSAGDALGITMPSFSQTGSGFNSTAALENTTPSGVNSSFLQTVLDCCVSKNGVYLYTIDQNSSATIRQFTMSTPYDLSTATHTYNYTPTQNTTAGTCTIAINNDGTKLYSTMNHSNADYLRVFSFGTAYNVNTLTHISNDVLGAGSGGGGTTGNAGKFRWSADGTKAYFMPFSNRTGNSTVGGTSGSIDNRSGSIFQYVVSSPFNTSSFNSTSTIRVPFKGDNYASFAVASDGKWLLNHKYQQQYMYVYPLSTPYDISTQVVASEVRIDTSPRNSSSTNTQGGIGMDHVNGILFNASYNKNRIDANRYATNLSFTVPTSQYHVGVTNSGGRIDSSAFVDINSMTAAQVAGTGTVNYAVSTDGRTTWSVNKGTGGVRPIVRNNSGTWQYNSAESLWGISSASYTNTSFSVNSQESNPTGIVFKPDGTKMYITGYSGDDVNEYNLSPAFDITSATYSQNFSVQSQDSVPNNIFFKPDGTKMYMVGSSSDNINEYSLSTAWNVSTLSYVRYLGMPSGLQNPTGIFFKSDGTRMYIVADPNKAVMYSLSTAWDISTASVSHTHTVAENTLPQDLFFKDDGTKVYILGEGGGNQKVYEYNLSTAWDLSTISYSSYSFDVSSQSPGCKAMTFKPDGSKMYILGTDNDIIYEYNTLSYGTSATWSNGTVNNELYTLQQALSLESNRMNKAQLDAIPDANHFATGSSLDLMIALRMDAAASTLPTSDGVTLNYDSASLNEGAVLGTDYDYFFPSSTKVQIKSLAAQNLKVRVV
jgi:hypothetical protein